jgi:hypothetical protein
MVQGKSASLNLVFTYGLPIYLVSFGERQSLPPTHCPLVSLDTIVGNQWAIHVSVSSDSHTLSPVAELELFCLPLCHYYTIVI